MSINIKQADLSDIIPVSKLFDEYRIFYKQGTDIDLASRFLTERINNNESVIFVAIDQNNNYLGFTQLYPSFSSVYAKRLWVLNDLYVRAQARRQGVAKRLMAVARDYALETKAKGLVLETARDNIKAQKLYESIGYQRTSGTYHYRLDCSSD